MNSDEKVTADVLEELRWEPKLGGEAIRASAKSGAVTLSGSVHSYPEKLAAEMAARRVRGVKSVVEALEVRLPDHARSSDDEIAEIVRTRLAWNASVPKNAIEVNVAKGWVTLSGEVPWHYQKEAVSDEVRRVRGVVGITNLTMIEPKATSGHISNDIMHALHRSRFDPHGIFVTGYDGRITLSGTVDSWHDYDLAFATAWAASGTTNVENDIALV